jgi:hypothetical protein
MEKRRVAPGWLDMDQKMLVPERRDQPHSPVASTSQAQQANIMDTDTQVLSDGGAELDRAFGGLGLR